MHDNYNYPMGADTPDAPWNQPEPKVETLKCYVSQTLIKHTDVYDLDCDFEKAYKEYRYTPLELINEFARVLPELIEKAKQSGHHTEAYKLKNLLKDCKDWEEEEFYACDDD